MIPDRHRDLAAAVIERCRAEGLRLALAESCTGGLIAAAVTAVPGSSDVFERGYVTYSNDAKSALLGVPAALIERDGAVSEAVACAMADGALSGSPADVSAAVTGVAGPGGGTEAKPVGLVHIAAARRGRPPLHERHVFPGDRDAVRAASVEAALRLLGRRLDR